MCVYFTEPTLAGICPSRTARIFLLRQSRNSTSDGEPTASNFLIFFYFFFEMVMTMNDSAGRSHPSPRGLKERVNKWKHFGKTFSRKVLKGASSEGVYSKEKLYSFMGKEGKPKVFCFHFGPRGKDGYRREENKF